MSEKKVDPIKLRDRYRKYALGFQDGASIQAMKYADDADYALGYKRGQADRRKAGDEFARMIGFDVPAVRVAS